MSSRKPISRVEKDKPATKVTKISGSKGKTERSPPRPTRKQKRSSEDDTKGSPAIDDQGFELIETKVQKKGRWAAEREEAAREINDWQGPVRRISAWTTKLLKPKAINEEWRQVLEQGEMTLPRNFFEDRRVGSHTGKMWRNELEALIETYLYMLNTDHNMLEIFFVRERTGWNILPPTAHNSHYFNFRRRKAKDTY